MRSQAGRVRGYQPTLDEFNELLTLSQKGMDSPKTTAKIRYRQGSEVTTSGKGISKIELKHLSKLIEESGNPKRLINFKFSAKQKNPSRRIEVAIRLDGWTYYEVASNDFTWALGRFHELTEMLLSNRSDWAVAQSPLPQVVTPGQYYSDWGGPLWIATYDQRVTLIRRFKRFPIWFAFFIILVFVIQPPPFSPIQVIKLGSFAITYIAATYGYLRWLSGTLRSYVSITPSQLNIKSLITNKEANPIDRGIFLTAVAGVIINILTLLLDALR